MLLVSYDTGYDDANRALTSVTCSDGTNGLITKYGWQIQGAIAGFPRIGGYVGVESWNSPQVMLTQRIQHTICADQYCIVWYLLWRDL